MEQKFNSGQEVIYQDLDSISTRLQREFYDRIFKRLLQGTVDAFFGDDFKVLFTGGVAATVKAGIGLQEDLAVNSNEPTLRPLYRSADVNINFDTPDNSNPRIDLVVVKHAKIDAESELRKFKAEFSEDITDVNFVVARDWQAEILIVKGTAAGSPVAPAVPAGYVKIAECLINASVGMGSQNDITDSRVLLPQASSTTASGDLGYDKIVGDISKIGVTHGTLAAALAAASIGDRILVTQSEAVDSIPQVNVANVEIIFKKGVTISKNGVVTGLRISANYCTVKNGRFSGFSTAGDFGVTIDNGVQGTILDALRYLNCDTNVSDSGDNTFINVEYTE